MRRVWALFARDIAAMFGNGQSALLSLAFLTMAASLFPFAVGPDRALLAPISSGAIWVIALFLGILHLEKIYGPDDANGSLELLMAAGLPIWLITLSKALAHWLISFAPLILFTPVLLIMLAGDTQGAGAIMLALGLGTPALSLIGGLGAALTLGAGQAALVVTLIILPLMLPTLIFGVSVSGGGASSAFVNHASALQYLLSVTLFCGVLCPIGTQAALKAAVK